MIIEIDLDKKLDIDDASFINVDTFTAEEAGSTTGLFEDKTLSSFVPTTIGTVFNHTYTKVVSQLQDGRILPIEEARIRTYNLLYSKYYNATVTCIRLYGYDGELVNTIDNPGLYNNAGTDYNDIWINMIGVQKIEVDVQAEVVATSTSTTSNLLDVSKIKVESDYYGAFDIGAHTSFYKSNTSKVSHIPSSYIYSSIKSNKEPQKIKANVITIPNNAYFKAGVSKPTIKGVFIPTNTKVTFRTYNRQDELQESVETQLKTSNATLTPGINITEDTYRIEVETEEFVATSTTYPYIYISVSSSDVLYYMYKKPDCYTICSNFCRDVEPLDITTAEKQCTVRLLYYKDSYDNPLDIRHCVIYIRENACVSSGSINRTNVGIWKEYRDGDTITIKSGCTYDIMYHKPESLGKELTSSAGNVQGILFTRNEFEGLPEDAIKVNLTVDTARTVTKIPRVKIPVTKMNMASFFCNLNSTITNQNTYTHLFGSYFKRARRAKPQVKAFDVFVDVGTAYTSHSAIYLDFLDENKQLIKQIELAKANSKPKEQTVTVDSNFDFEYVRINVAQAKTGSSGTNRYIYVALTAIYTLENEKIHIDRYSFNEAKAISMLDEPALLGSTRYMTSTPNINTTIKLSEGTKTDIPFYIPMGEGNVIRSIDLSYIVPSSDTVIKRAYIDLYERNSLKIKHTVDVDIYNDTFINLEPYDAILANLVLEHEENTNESVLIKKDAIRHYIKFGDDKVVKSSTSSGGINTGNYDNAYIDFMITGRDYIDDSYTSTISDSITAYKYVSSDNPDYEIEVHIQDGLNYARLKNGKKMSFTAGESKAYFVVFKKYPANKRPTVVQSMLIQQQMPYKVTFKYNTHRHIEYKEIVRIPVTINLETSRNKIVEENNRYDTAVKTKIEYSKRFNTSRIIDSSNIPEILLECNVDDFSSRNQFELSGGSAIHLNGKYHYCFKEGGYEEIASDSCANEWSSYNIMHDTYQDGNNKALEYAWDEYSYEDVGVFTNEYEEYAQINFYVTTESTNREYCEFRFDYRFEDGAYNHCLEVYHNDNFIHSTEYNYNGNGWNTAFVNIYGGISYYDKISIRFKSMDGDYFYSRVFIKNMVISDIKVASNRITFKYSKDDSIVPLTPFISGQYEVEIQGNKLDVSNTVCQLEVADNMEFINSVMIDCYNPKPYKNVPILGYVRFVAQRSIEAPNCGISYFKVTNTAASSKPINVKIIADTERRIGNADNKAVDTTRKVIDTKHFRLDYDYLKNHPNSFKMNRMTVNRTDKTFSMDVYNEELVAYHDFNRGTNGVQNIEYYFTFPYVEGENQSQDVSVFKYGKEYNNLAGVETGYGAIAIPELERMYGMVIIDNLDLTRSTTVNFKVKVATVGDLIEGEASYIEVSTDTTHETPQYIYCTNMYQEVSVTLSREDMWDNGTGRVYINYNNFHLGNFVDVEVRISDITVTQENGHGMSMIFQSANPISTKDIKKMGVNITWDADLSPKATKQIGFTSTPMGGLFDTNLQVKSYYTNKIEYHLSDGVALTDDCPDEAYLTVMLERPADLKEYVTFKSVELIVADKFKKEVKAASDTNRIATVIEELDIDTAKKAIKDDTITSDTKKVVHKTDNGSSDVTRQCVTDDSVVLDTNKEAVTSDTVSTESTRYLVSSMDTAVDTERTVVSGELMYKDVKVAQTSSINLYIKNTTDSIRKETELYKICSNNHKMKKATVKIYRRYNSTWLTGNTEQVYAKYKLYDANKQPLTEYLDVPEGVLQSQYVIVDIDTPTEAKYISFDIYIAPITVASKENRVRLEITSVNTSNMKASLMLIMPATIESYEANNRWIHRYGSFATPKEGIVCTDRTDTYLAVGNSTFTDYDSMTNTNKLKYNISATSYVYVKTPTQDYNNLVWIEEENSKININKKIDTQRNITYDAELRWISTYMDSVYAKTTSKIVNGITTIDETVFTYNLYPDNYKYAVSKIEIMAYRKFGSTIFTSDYTGIDNENVKLSYSIDGGFTYKELVTDSVTRRVTIDVAGTTVNNIMFKMSGMNLSNTNMEICASPVRAQIYHKKLQYVGRFNEELYARKQDVSINGNSYTCFPVNLDVKNLKKICNLKVEYSYHSDSYVKIGLTDKNTGKAVLIDGKTAEYNPYVHDTQVKIYVMSSKYYPTALYMTTIANKEAQIHVDTLRKTSGKTLKFIFDSKRSVVTKDSTTAKTIRKIAKGSNIVSDTLRMINTSCIRLATDTLRKMHNSDIEIFDIRRTTVKNSITANKTTRKVHKTLSNIVKTVRQISVKAVREVDSLRTTIANMIKASDTTRRTTHTNYATIKTIRQVACTEYLEIDTRRRVRKIIDMAVVKLLDSGRKVIKKDSATVDTDRFLGLPLDKVFDSFRNTIANAQYMRDAHRKVIKEEKKVSQTRREIVIEEKIKQDTQREVYWYHNSNKTYDLQREVVKEEEITRGTRRGITLNEDKEIDTERNVFYRVEERITVDTRREIVKEEKKEIETRRMPCYYVDKKLEAKRRDVYHKGTYLFDTTRDKYVVDMTVVRYDTIRAVNVINPYAKVYEYNIKVCNSLKFNIKM